MKDELAQELRNEDEMASVSIKESGSVAGIWVVEGDKQIGIVAEDGKGAYIAFYDTKSSLTPFAVTVSDLDKDGENDLVVQVPDKGDVKFKQFNLSKLFNLLSRLS